MRIYQGESFLARFGKAGELLSRDSFTTLEEYMNGAWRNRACILYGLRRTGKSVMMFQSMLRRVEKSAYILCDSRDTLDALASAMDALWDAGVRNFFLDEVTIIPDFIGGCQFLADAYTGTGRVVMAGTDSLSFAIADDGALACRTVFIHTTHIPFREHARLLGTKNLDEYAAYGGILSNPDDYRNYPLRAIALNIQNSLAHDESHERFGALRKLWQTGGLTAAIQKIVRNEGHRFTRNIIQETWNLSDFTMARRAVSEREARALAGDIPPAALLSAVSRMLGTDTDVKVTAGEIAAINRFLQHLDLIEPGLSIHEDDLSDDDETRKKAAKKLSWDFRRKNPDGHWIFRQPGLRWTQVEVLLDAIRREVPFHMDTGKNVLEPLFRMIRANAMGRLMEDIIIADTTASLGHRFPVFRLVRSIGEVDMVIIGENAISMYEIKHSAEPRPGFGKHVFDGTLADALEKQFSMPVRERGVLYSGNTGERHGFISAADYLMSLGPDKPKPGSNLGLDESQNFQQHVPGAARLA